MWAAQEASIEYNFKPGDLEPAEFWLSAQVFYNSSVSPHVTRDQPPFRKLTAVCAQSEMYANTIYNGTIELVELRSGSEVRRLFTYLLVFAVLGLVAYVVLQLNKTIKVTSRSRAFSRRGMTAICPQTKKPRAVERGTVEQADVSVYTPKSKAQAVRRKKAAPVKEKSPRAKKTSGSASADDE